MTPMREAIAKKIRERFNRPMSEVVNLLRDFRESPEVQEFIQSITAMRNAGVELHIKDAWPRGHKVIEIVTHGVCVTTLGPVDPDILAMVTDAIKGIAPTIIKEPTKLRLARFPR